MNFPCVTCGIHGYGVRPVTDLPLFTRTPGIALADLPPNPFDPPCPEKEYPGSQTWRIYERLKLGKVSNGEIIYQMRIANSTGRASELRAFLKRHGFDLRSDETGNASEWTYEIVRE